MHAPNQPVSPSAAQDKQPPLATFKSSLRAWQAEYQARLAAQQAAAAEKAGIRTVLA